MVKPWKEFRQEITRLYMEEALPLRDVQKIMRERHGFQASIRSYRQHFDQWNLQKYNCKKRQRRLQRMLPSPPGTPLLASGDMGAGAATHGDRSGCSSQSGSTQRAASHLGYLRMGFYCAETQLGDNGVLADKRPPADTARYIARRLAPDIGYEMFVTAPVGTWHHHLAPSSSDAGIENPLPVHFDQRRLSPMWSANPQVPVGPAQFQV